MTDAEPRFLPFGDAALLVEYGRRVDRGLSARVLALDAAVQDAAIPGIVETAPSFRSLMVQFDPLQTELGAVVERLRPLAEQAVAERSDRPARIWRIPACYEGDCAPDLDEVAERAGLDRSAVVDLHVGQDHHVYMIGFLPGCPYMGDLPAEIDFPRRKDPRMRVPAGSVAIAIGLTVIYPADSPGGWRLIGRTPAALFDPAAVPPILLEPGDAVRFEPIGARAYERIAVAVAAGDWRPERIDAVELAGAL